MIQSISKLLFNWSTVVQCTSSISQIHSFQVLDFWNSIQVLGPDSFLDISALSQWEGGIKSISSIPLPTASRIEEGLTRWQMNLIETGIFGTLHASPNYLTGFELI